MGTALRILMVEDSAADAEMIARQLRDAGLVTAIKRVTTEAALRRELVTGAYDIILADYHLPGFDGFAALQLARELAPALPFIFVSGSIGEERAIHALREGATDYIIKDRPSRLPAAVLRALEEKRDADMRRRMQEALLRSEQRFHFAVVATRDVIWDVDLGRGTTWLSNAIVTDWGYALHDAEVGYDWWLEKIWPADVERVTESLDAAVAGGAERWDAEYAFRRADGTYAAVLDRGIIVRDPGRRPLRIIGAMQDIAGRVEAQKRLQEVSRINSLILDNAGEGILAVDVEGKPIFANPAALRLLQWSENDLAPAADAHDALHECDRDRACALIAAMEDASSRQGEDRFRRKDGSLFFVEASYAPMYDEERGGISGCVVVFRDVDEQKRLRRQLEQAERISSLGRVAATLAHEFNNVLMGIQPFAELVQKRSSEERMVQAATQIISTVGRGRRITQDILRTTQSSQPRLQLTDATRWLRQIAPELTALAGERVNVKFEIPALPLHACFDGAQLQQVIANLTVNARDAIAAEGTVTIALDAEGDVVRLTVTDDGAGIRPEVLPHIFEPLYTTKHSGTGLGLAVVQQLVAANHGVVSVQSDPGKGTRFEILLPRVAPPAEQRKEAPVRTVLLIQDDHDGDGGRAALLAREGIVVETVDASGDVEGALARVQPDAVIIHLVAPGADGTEVYERISARSPAMPVVFCSDDHHQSRLAAYLSRGSVRFLRKPCEVEALIRTLRDLVRAA